MKGLLKYIAKSLMTLCRSFPINIYLNRYNENKLIMYSFYVLLLPVELIWVGVRYLNGVLIEKFKKNYKYNSAIVSIIKNEALYLDEWIAYHRDVVGVDHFYLYNNNSSDNTAKVLEKYVKKGIVDFVNLKGQQRQVDAYNLAILSHKAEAKYLVVIDVDEFLQLTDQSITTLDDIINPLITKNDVGGIGVNWCMFGSGGEKHYKNELVTKRFVFKAEQNNPSNHYIKSIINPRLTIGFFKAHAAYYWPGYYTVNCVGERISGSMTDVCIHYPLRLNHYFTKSKEEFELKRKRGMADQRGIRNENNFIQYDLNDLQDCSMREYSDIILSAIARYKM